MAIYFDNVLEYLTENDKQLCGYLRELKKMIPADVCPRGELERSYMCRQFLRDSTAKVQKKLKDSGMRLNKDTVDVLEQTISFIEEIGDFSEKERALIVIRNLLILMENLTILQDDKKLHIPVPRKRNKGELSIETSEISESGKKAFQMLLDIPDDLEKNDLLKPLVNERVMKAVNKAKVLANELECNAVEERYRTMFYYLVISEVFREADKQ